MREVFPKSPFIYSLRSRTAVCSFVRASLDSFGKNARGTSSHREFIWDHSSQAVVHVSYGIHLSLRSCLRVLFYERMNLFVRYIWWWSGMIRRTTSSMSAAPYSGNVRRVHPCDARVRRSILYTTGSSFWTYIPHFIFVKLVS